MEDGTPALEVGFAINTGGSFDELVRLQNVMDSTEGKVLADAARIEKATGGMVNLGGATASITAFGNAHTREMQNVIRDRNAAEKSGEGMIRQLQRQAETFGKTATEIRNMRAEMRAVAAEAQGLTELAGRIRAANAEMIRLESGTGGVTNAAVKNRMAMQGASYQVQDLLTQASMGGNVLNAFAVQGAQLAGQFSNIEGKAGDVARFFMGPWGLAITAGLMFLGPLVAKLFEHNNALDDAVAKLKKDAAETETTAKAKELFKKTQEGLNVAIRDQVEALRKSQISQAEELEAAVKSAVSNANLTLRIRERTAAIIDLARAQLAADMADTKSPDINRQFRIQQVTAMLKDLETRLGTAKAGVTLAQEAVDRANVALGEYRAKALVDQAAKINEQADAEIRAAKKRALASHMSADAIAVEIAAINRRREASLKEQSEAEKKARETVNQVGRTVTLSDAERIVQSIGGVITSTTRTFEQQRVLYERYLAGKGPLAAKPGTSDHEFSNALDIAKTPGMSLAKIRDAFRAQGVAIKQLLDEGDHFHVAWKKGADSAAAASKSLADVQADLAKKFDPAAAAARDYREALASIAGAKLDPATAARYAEAAADAFRKARAAAFELPSMAGISADAASQTAAEKSAEEFQRNVIQPLKDELALYGLVGPARAAAALELEKEAFIAKNIGEGIDVATARWLAYYDLKKKLIGKDDAAQREVENVKRIADEFDRMTEQARAAGNAIAHAFGQAGNAVADLIDIVADYAKRQKEIDEQAAAGKMKQADAAKASGELQLQSMGALAGAAKNLFKEHSKGYEAMAAAEKALAIVQAINTAKNVAAAAAKIFAALGPWAFPVVAAMLGVMGGLGFFGGGSGSQKLPEANTGTGTVLGDSSAKSDSIKRAIDSLKDVDALTNIYARDMSASLKSIDSQIGGFATQILRAGNIDATGNVKTGFQMDATGKLLKNLVDPLGILSKIPLIGGIFSGISNLIGSLFGSTTTVTGNGLFGGPQSVGSVLSGGFDAQYYSDLQKKSKFLGITTGTKNYTQYSAADPALEAQFTLILRSFNDAIKAAAGPLGESTDAIQARLNSFVVNIGKIDLKGLTGEQIQDKLTAIFGAAADNMANAAFPGMAAFQKVGEGAFETLVRVASTVEAVSNSLDVLGQSATGMSIAAKLGLADQFESVSALTNAADAYFQSFYSKEEQTAARTVQMTRVFSGLGLQMPATLAAFRQLVEAQDLTTAAGQATYATLLQLAPAFADLKGSLEGVKSAADIASERMDLQRQLLEVQGDTAAIRAMDLAKLDETNRAIQLQIWAIQDAQEAAKAADELRQAWTSVGDSIMDEVKRIRGLSDPTGNNSFASLLGQFNAANEAARTGDMDAAKSLPGLSQALLTAAAAAATSQQELLRVQAQTAASLEATNAAILAQGAAATSNSALLAASADAAAASSSNDNSTSTDLRAAMDEMRAELAQLRSDTNSGNAAIAANTNKIARKLDDVTADSGGNAISTVAA